MAFCFANSSLLSIYFPKYLQFLLNNITHCKNCFTEHPFLQDYGPWKWKFFIFANFIFSTLEDFSEKTYEKTCRFYNIFSKFISNCTRLPSFTIWAFFAKILWPFQSNIHFFHFQPLFRENLWKDRPILWLIFKFILAMYTLKKFSHLKIFTKKIMALSKS